MYHELEEYTSHFNLNDSGIKLKYEHSLRVADISKQIASNLGWDLEDVKLATKIGLLHDIGRMQEWKIFKSYAANDFDHGDLGVEILKKDNYYKKFEIDEKDKQTIFDAVYHHNKYDVPEEVDNKFIKLIRDADKVDIFHIYACTDYQAGLGGDDIHPKVKEEFEKGELINGVKNIKTFGDHILRTLAFIYDVNYDYSLKIIKDEKYIDKFYQNLENKELYKPYFDKINKLIEERLK